MKAELRDMDTEITNESPMETASPHDTDISNEVFSLSGE